MESIDGSYSVRKLYFVASPVYEQMGPFVSPWSINVIHAPAVLKLWGLSTLRSCYARITLPAASNSKARLTIAFRVGCGPRFQSGPHKESSPSAWTSKLSNLYLELRAVESEWAHRETEHAVAIASTKPMRCWGCKWTASPWHSASPQWYVHPGLYSQSLQPPSQMVDSGVVQLTIRPGRNFLCE